MKNVNSRQLTAAVTFVMCAMSVPLRAQTDVAGVSRSIRDAFSIKEQESDSVPPLFVDVGQVVQQPAGPPPTPRHTGVRALVKSLVSDVKHLPSKENLFWVVVGSGLALAVHPLDDNVNRGLVGSSTADKVFKAGAILGNLGTLLGTAGTVYAVGRIEDEPRVSHVGMDLIRGLII